MDEQTKQWNIVIGIDPDNVESGVAMVRTSPDKTEHTVEVQKMSFPALCDWLRMVRADKNYYSTSVVVVLEGGWLNASNWHALGKYMSAAKAAAIGRSVGMNHQTGILIGQMCVYLGITCKEVKPLRKIWKGPDGKITQEEITRVLKMGMLPRMNQDTRDALLLAWTYRNEKKTNKNAKG